MVHLPVRKQEKRKKAKTTDHSGKKVIEGLLRMSVKGGPKDLSINHDQVLEFFLAPPIKVAS